MDYSLTDSVAVAVAHNCKHSFAIYVIRNSLYGIIISFDKHFLMIISISIRICNGWKEQVCAATRDEMKKQQREFNEFFLQQDFLFNYSIFFQYSFFFVCVKQKEKNFGFYKEKVN